jgi:hypothetical protein
MRCGWGCGAEHTGHQLRAHLTVCREDVDLEQDYHPVLPFCSQCVSERCGKCRSWVRVRKFQQDPIFNLIGRPRGPRMKCGWGCGEQLTASRMLALGKR